MFPSRTRPFAAVTLILGFVIAAGCGPEAPSAAPSAAPAPLPSARPPSPQANAPRPSPNPVAKPQKVPPLPAAQPRDGELLADIQKDFRAAENGHADSSGLGQWHYLASPTACPGLSPRSLSAMTWQPGNSPQFIVSLPEEPRVLGSISADNEQAAILTPARFRYRQEDGQMLPLYPALRWVSGVDGDVAIQGRFSKLPASRTDGVEAYVFVDGAQQFHADLAATDFEGPVFEFSASVLRGSCVDFVVSPHGPGETPDPFEGDATRLTVRIVRTGAEPTGIQPPASARARIQETLAASPIRPLPADSTKISVHNPSAQYEWWQSELIEPTGAVQDNRHDTAQEEFLKGYCARISGHPSAPPDFQLMAAGKSLLTTANPNPAIFVAVAHLATDQGAHARGPGRETAVSALGLGREACKSPGCSPLVNAMMERRWVLVFGSNRLAQRVYDLFVQAAAMPNLSSRDRQMLALLADQWVENRWLDVTRQYLAGKLASTPEVDPWLRELVLARHHRHLAWEARGSGYANTVTEEGWRQFGIQMQHAKAHALRAWELQPELPEAAVEMIDIAMSSDGVAGEDKRFWFDEAVQADPANDRAYERYTWFLRPRWGGSHEAMLVFARECLATERFETNVPGRYHTIAESIVSELGSREALLRMPGVYEDYVKLFEGYAQAADDEKGRLHLRTKVAALAWVAGKREESFRLLKVLGPQADRTSFATFDLSFSEVAHAMHNADRPVPSYFADDPGQAAAVAFTADGERLISPKPSGELIVWDVKTRKTQQTLPAHSQPIVCLQASPDGQYLVTAGRDNQALIWDVKKLEKVSQLGLDFPPHEAAWSPDGKKIVIACGENGPAQAIEWNVEAGTHAAEPFQPPGGLGRLSYASDGHWLFSPATSTPGDPQQLGFWSREQRGVDRPLQAFHRFLTAWDLSTDATKLVVAGIESFQTGGRPLPRPEIVLLDAETGQMVRMMAWAPGEITGLEFLADGERLAGTCSNGCIFVWNSSTARLEGCIRTRLAGLKSLTVSPDESRLAALDQEGRIHVWPLDDRQLGWRIESPLLDSNLSFSVREIIFAEDDRTLLVESARGGISIWSTTERCSAASRYFTLAVHPDVSRFYPNGKRMVCFFRTAPDRNVAKVIDVETGGALKQLEIGNRNAMSVSVSPDSEFIAVGDSAGEIHLVDAQTLEDIPWGRLAESTDQAAGAAVSQVAFSADSRSLASSQANGTIQWWDLPAKTDAAAKPPISRFTFAGPRGAVGSLVISPDGALVAASAANTIVYDAQTGQPHFEVPGFKAAFSPDGAFLCTNGGAADYVDAAIWDARTGKQVALLGGGHSYAIFSIAYSPNGDAILTGDQNGTVRAWNAATGEEWMEFPLLRDKE